MTRTDRHRTKRGTLRGEWLEPKLCLAPFALAEHIIDRSELEYVSDIRSADLDGDNDLDIVIASSGVGATIGWYENLDGNATFGQQRLIQRTQSVASLDVSDVDSDGDLDIFAGYTNRLVWYQNLGSNGQFADASRVNEDAAYGSPLATSDLDGDGDLDLISNIMDADPTSQLQVVWNENTDGQGTFGPPQVIASGYRAEVADLNGDQAADVIVVSDNTITAYQNIDGSGTFGSPRVVRGQASHIAVATLDSDGHPDLITVQYSGSQSNLGWFKNLDGQGTFTSRTMIADARSEIASIQIADVDQDNDLDIVYVSPQAGEIGWYENKDGKGDFATPQIIDVGTPSYSYMRSSSRVEVADLDGDFVFALAGGHYESAAQA